MTLKKDCQKKACQNVSKWSKGKEKKYEKRKCNLPCAMNVWKKEMQTHGTDC